MARSVLGVQPRQYGSACGRDLDLVQAEKPVERLRGQGRRHPRRRRRDSVDASRWPRPKDLRRQRLAVHADMLASGRRRSRPSSARPRSARPASRPPSISRRAARSGRLMARAGRAAGCSRPLAQRLGGSPTRERRTNQPRPSWRAVETRADPAPGSSRSHSSTSWWWSAREAGQDVATWTPTSRPRGQPLASSSRSPPGMPRTTSRCARRRGSRARHLLPVAVGAELDVRAFRLELHASTLCPQLLSGWSGRRPPRPAPAIGGGTIARRRGEPTRTAPGRDLGREITDQDRPPGKELLRIYWMRPE